MLTPRYTVTNLVASGSGPRYDVLAGTEEQVVRTLRDWQTKAGNDLLDVMVRDESGRSVPALDWLAEEARF